MPRPLRVFLCHASQDKLAVRELYSALKTEGWIDPWLDKAKILPGQDWRLVIEKAVEDADVVIVCLSNQSVTKEGFVQREIKYSYDIALEKPEETIFLIPLRLDNCIVPRGLRSFHWVDYFGAEKKDSYSDLLEALKLRYNQKLDLEADWLATDKVEHEKAEREEVEKVAREKKEKEIVRQYLDEKTERNRRALVERATKERKVNEFIDQVLSFFSLYSRQLAIGGILLLVLIFGGFGLNYLIKNLPIPIITASATKTATTKIATFTSMPLAHTPTPTKTPMPTPTIGIGSTMTGDHGEILVYVPAGEFRMGSDNGESYEKPVHTVYLDAFWIDQFEVTNKQYQACVDAGTCEPPSSKNSFTHPSYYLSLE